MKKLIAIALAAMLAPAWGAEVVSSNIVGYQKLDLRNGFTIVGSQFLNVGADTKDIQELVASDTDMVGLDANLNFQTELRVWSGTGYDIYGWDSEGDPEVAGSDHKWVNGDLQVMAFDIPVGEAVWIKSPAAASITLSGEVPEGTTQSQEIKVGFNLIANPFPVATSVQDIQLSDEIPGLDENLNFQTELRVWSGTGYDIYGWDSEGDPEVAGSDHKWVNGDLQVVDVTIPMGQGFWIKSTTAGTVTFKK